MSGRQTVCGEASVTARRHTSSIETISNFQRFSARIVRSRNLRRDFARLERLKPAALPRTHALEPQDDAGAAGLAAASARHSR